MDDLNQSGWSIVYANTIVNTGVWTHVAMTKSGQTIKFYVNGIFDVQKTIDSDQYNSTVSTGAIYLGREGMMPKFQGKMDEVRIWKNTVHSQTQIQANMYKTLQGDESGLIAYYDFEKGTGTTLTDKTTNNNNGTLTNMDSTDWINGIIGNPTLTTQKDTALNNTLPAYDADGDALTYFIANSDGGAAVLDNTSPGAFTYTPTTSGTRTFTYQVKDDTKDSNIATITVIVTSLVVDSTDDTDDGDYSPGQNTLREAIANASAGDTITFDSSIAEQTIKLDNQLTIDKNLTIDGTGQNITISGDNAVRVFVVTAGNSIFRNLTIKDGHVGSENSGGGIRVDVDGTKLTIENCTLTNNRATQGGAIYAAGWTATEINIINSTITNNHATNGPGGGVRGESAKVNILNSTIAGNTATEPGAGVRFYYNDFGTIKNSILANNLATIGANDCHTDTYNIGSVNNLIQSANNCGIVSTSNPLLNTLANNGGDTQTMALQAGSPAIDAGDNATCASLPGGNKDQRGAVRGTSCDIGAFEYNFPPVASSVNLSGIPTVGQTLTGSYNYSDIENDLEGTSTFQWYSADDATCTTGKQPLSGATNTTYVLTSSEAGQYVCFEVTPVASAGNITVGTAVLTTSPTTIKADQTIIFGALSDKIYGNLPFTIRATTTSGLLASFSAIGSCTILGNTITLIEPGSCTITASQEGNSAYNAASDVSQSFNIAIPVYKLTVSKTGQGTITSENLNCGKECQQYYDAGTDVTLNATPDDGWTLESWGGDCDNQGKVQINSETICTATFISLPPSVSEHVLTVAIIGEGSVIGEGIDCGTECKLIVPTDETRTVALTAKPDIEWILDSWSGDCDSHGYLQIDADKTCTATFIEDYNIPNDGDANGDGIQDSQQQNIVSIPDAIEGDYLSIQVEGEEATITNVYTDLAENLDEFDDSYVFPQGVLYFEIEGQEADVTIYYYGLQVAYHPVFQKFGPTIPGDLNTIGWYVLPDVIFDTVIINGQPVVTASYHLKDGELGDNTGVDGRIVDPGGISLIEYREF